jgi:acyl carrier protein
MDIKVWLQQKIAEESGQPLEEILYDTEFSNFKLDSLSIVTLAYELESMLNIELSPTAFTEFNTINKLAEWIQSQK